MQDVKVGYEVWDMGCGPVRIPPGKRDTGFICKLIFVICYLPRDIMHIL